MKQTNAGEPIHHPLWGAPTLAAMRTMFRVVNAVPPMRRRMARSETRLRDRKLHPALAAAGE
ncbi:MAG: hypothetical protein J2P40_08650 [Candidatus Dormibacteraeota bacterium]|nr:hypothetical protein [Candidatus Dormibacteraeota bacterium]MBO0761330.1 hypothetical protein [Candidatus Dormibacteraeota bacterium]